MGFKHKEVEHTEEMHRIFNHIKARKPTAIQLEEAYLLDTLDKIARMFYILKRSGKKIDLANQISVASRL